MHDRIQIFQFFHDPSGNEGDPVIAAWSALGPDHGRVRFLALQSGVLPGNPLVSLGMSFLEDLEKMGLISRDDDRDWKSLKITSRGSEVADLIRKDFSTDLYGGQDAEFQ